MPFGKFHPKNLDPGKLFWLGTIQGVMGRRGKLQNFSDQASREFAKKVLIKLEAGTNTGNGKRRKQGTEALFGAIFGISSGKHSTGHNLLIFK